MNFSILNFLSREMLFKNIVRIWQNSFSIFITVCVKVGFSYHSTINANCYKVLISFVYDVWQVIKIFDPKMSLDICFFCFFLFFFFQKYKRDWA